LDAVREVRLELHSGAVAPEARRPVAARTIHLIALIPPAA
jgi:hypothetical protein